jgi:hypothetical protein
LDTLPDEELLACSRILEPQANVESRLYWGLLSERAQTVAWAEQLLTDPHAFLSEVLKGGWDERLQLYRWPMTAPLARYDAAFVLGRRTRLVQLAENSIENYKQAKQFADESVANLPEWYVLARNIVITGRVFLVDVKVTATIRCTRTGLAAERYRIAHGNWPEQLEQLVPKYLEAVPEDPFDNKPLKYSRINQGIVVYSVSENGVDDGGMIESRHAGSLGPPPDVGMMLLDPALRGRAPAASPSSQDADGENAAEDTLILTPATRAVE